MSDLDPGTDRQLKSALHSAKRKPPEITSPGAFRIAGIGYIRRSNDAPLEISPRKRDQDVAAVRHSCDFKSARKARADNSRLLQSARRARPRASALRVSTSQMILSISAPSSVRLIRITVDNTITTSRRSTEPAHRLN